MASFLYEYDKFYDYYTNPNNYVVDNSPRKIIWYYIDEPYTNQKPLSVKLSRKYIVVNNKQLYIKTTNTGGILFTFPVKINGKLWDFHYHFGLSDFKNNKTGKFLVYFHKTIQNPSKTGKERDNCYFDNIQTVTDVSILRCGQTRNDIMYELFSKNGEDYAIIEELISRPFLGIRIGGNSKNKTLKKNKKTKKRRTIRTPKNNSIFTRRRY